MQRPTAPAIRVFHDIGGTHWLEATCPASRSGQTGPEVIKGVGLLTITCAWRHGRSCATHGGRSAWPWR
jgi:hypothetical protein